MDETNEPEPWPRQGSRKADNLLLFQPRWDAMQNPRTGEVFQRLVLETHTWTNIVAITPEDEFVMVKQDRFGTARVTTEIPGGVVDPGEDPLHAAQRELREETGYTSDDWSLLGSVEPNPAFHDNLCHHFLARDVRRTHELALDAGEDIRVTLLGRDALTEAIASGSINHSLVLTALCRVLDLRSHK